MQCYDASSDNDEDVAVVPAAMAPDEPPSSNAAGFEPVTAEFRGFGAKLASDISALCVAVR